MTIVYFSWNLFSMNSVLSLGPELASCTPGTCQLRPWCLPARWWCRHWTCQLQPRTCQLKWCQELLRAPPLPYIRAGGWDDVSQDKLPQTKGSGQGLPPMSLYCCLGEGVYLPDYKSECAHNHGMHLTSQSSKGALTSVHIARRCFRVSGVLQTLLKVMPKWHLSQNGDPNAQHVKESMTKREKESSRKDNHKDHETTTIRCPLKLDFNDPAYTKSQFSLF